jgi:hypothetical protein
MLFDMIAVQMQDAMSQEPRFIAEAFRLLSCLFFLVTKANNRLYCCFLFLITSSNMSKNFTQYVSAIHNLHYILSLSGNGGCGGE